MATHVTDNHNNSNSHALSKRNPDDKLAQSRERNREHARRTRLRKKAQLKALQDQVQRLDAERLVLQQSIEECSVASILVGLGRESSTSPTRNTPVPHEPTRRRRAEEVAANKRPRRTNTNNNSNSQDGDERETTSTHVNRCVDAEEKGNKQHLSPTQMEELRRERNRRHAKMTRDRKKSLLATLQRAVQELQRENDRLRQHLVDVQPVVISPATTPELVPANHTFTTEFRL